MICFGGRFPKEPLKTGCGSLDQPVNLLVSKLFFKAEYSRHNFNRNRHSIVMYNTDILVVVTSCLSTLCLLFKAMIRHCFVPSAHQGHYDVPRVATGLGQRSFAVAGPKAWNSLPSDDLR